MVGFALLKLESSQWNFTAVMKRILFQDNIPQMIGLRLLQFTKMLPINTKGVVSHKRGCPLSNCIACRANQRQAIFYTYYIGIHYRLLHSENK